MSHVHFDTESILKDMQANFGRLPSAPSDPVEFQAVNRHRDVTIALARMALEEANRGSQPDFIIWMCAQFCAEFLENMQNLADAASSEINSCFLQHLLDCIRQVEDGSAKTGVGYPTFGVGNSVQHTCSQIDLKG